MNIHQSGAPWNITNEKFVLEKVFGSPSFYEIEVTLDDDNSSKYILEVSEAAICLGFVYICVYLQSSI